MNSISRIEKRSPLRAPNSPLRRTASENRNRLDVVGTPLNNDISSPTARSVPRSRGSEPRSQSTKLRASPVSEGKALPAWNSSRRLTPPKYETSFKYRDFSPASNNSENDLSIQLGRTRSTGGSPYFSARTGAIIIPGGTPVAPASPTRAVYEAPLPLSMSRKTRSPTGSSQSVTTRAASATPGSRGRKTLKGGASERIKRKAASRGGFGFAARDDEDAGVESYLAAELQSGKADAAINTDDQLLTGDANQTANALETGAAFESTDAPAGVGPSDDDDASSSVACMPMGAVCCLPFVPLRVLQANRIAESGAANSTGDAIVASMVRNGSQVVVASKRSNVAAADIVPSPSAVEAPPTADAPAVEETQPMATTEDDTPAAQPSDAPPVVPAPSESEYDSEFDLDVEVQKCCAELFSSTQPITPPRRRKQRAPAAEEPAIDAPLADIDADLPVSLAESRQQSNAADSDVCASLPVPVHSSTGRASALEVAADLANVHAIMQEGSSANPGDATRSVAVSLHAKVHRSDSLLDPGHENSLARLFVSCGECAPSIVDSCTQPTPASPLAPAVSASQQHEVHVLTAQSAHASQRSQRSVRTNLDDNNTVVSVGRPSDGPVAGQLSACLPISLRAIPVPPPGKSNPPSPSPQHLRVGSRVSHGDAIMQQGPVASPMRLRGTMSASSSFIPSPESAKLSFMRDRQPEIDLLNFSASPIRAKATSSLSGSAPVAQRAESSSSSVQQTTTAGPASFVPQTQQQQPQTYAGYQAAGLNTVVVTSKIYDLPSIAAQQQQYPLALNTPALGAYPEPTASDVASLMQRTQLANPGDATPVGRGSPASRIGSFARASPLASHVPGQSSFTGGSKSGGSPSRGGF